MKKFLTICAIFLSLTVRAATILWAALDESSTIDSIAFRDYNDPRNLFVNAARLSVSDNSSYSSGSVTPLYLWIPEYDGDPGYWEEDFPVVCLKDEDGDWEMPEWSSQFNLGDNPNLNHIVFFELGYTDWDDPTAPFVTIATASASIQQLIDGKFTYPSGTLWPPDERNWMPTQFHAVPEPSAFMFGLLGCSLLFVSTRRKK